MKIVMVIESLRLGGKERQALELMKALRRVENVEMQLVVLTGEVGFQAIFETGVKIHCIDMNGKWKGKAVASIYKICQSFRPDILHSWGIFPTLYSWPAAKILNIKILNGSVRFAVPFKPFSKKWLAARMSYFMADMVVANSRTGLRAQKLDNADKNFVIHNGFDFERLKALAPAEEIKKKFSIKTKYVIGMVGSFSAAKDYATFIQAAYRVLALRKDVTFIGVGDGPNLEGIKAAILPESKEIIKFPGRQEMVEALVNVMDIGVLTCNTNGHAEGISNAIMEYMAFAKPVIATIGGGSSEIVEDQKTGFLIKPFDPNDLSARMVYLLDNESRRKEMGEAGKEKIKIDFNAQKMANGFLMLYEKLLK